MTVQALILVVVLGLHYRHVIVRLVYIWSNDSDWSHGFLIPLFGIYYLYIQRDRFPHDLLGWSLTPRLVGALLLLGAFVIHAGSTLARMEYPKTLALVITVMGVVLMVWGWAVARWSWFAVAFLVFAMPLPRRIYQEATVPLQRVAASASAVALTGYPGVKAYAEDTVVDWDRVGRKGPPPPPLNVEEACSGMRLLMTMMALGVAMAFVNERQMWQRLVMILACAPIAVFCNIIRVTTTGFFTVFGRPEWAHGTPHTLLGLGMLAIAFGLYGGLSHVLNHLFVEGEPEAEVQEMATGGTA